MIKKGFSDSTYCTSTSKKPAVTWRCHSSNSYRVQNTERVCEERKVMVKHIARYIDGTVFGNPNRKLRDRSVILRNVSHDQLLDVERRCSMPEKLALGLIQLLFTPEELKSGNCTKSIRSDIEQLDTKRLWAIKYKV